MRHWNYRVFKHTEPDGEIWFGIHETHYSKSTTDNSSGYNECDIDGFSTEPIKPFGETKKELKSDCEKFLAAFSKPVLDYNKLKG